MFSKKQTSLSRIHKPVHYLTRLFNINSNNSLFRLTRYSKKTNYNCNSTKIMEHFYFFKNITNVITSYKTNICRMINSKEIALIIIMAVSGFVLATFLSQVTKMITGIPGSNYLCCIFLAIYTSFSLLLHDCLLYTSPSPRDRS